MSNEVEFDLTISITAKDIVTHLGSDESLFMLIWQCLEHSSTGIEVKQRLFTQLDEDLRESGNHPDLDGDEKDEAP